MADYLPSPSSHPEDQLSAVDVLALNLDHSTLDSMSVNSDDSDDHQFADAIDSYKGVALATCTDTKIATSLPVGLLDVDVFANQSALPGDKDEIFCYHHLNADCDQFGPRITNRNEHSEISAQAATPTSQANSDFEVMLPAMRSYVDPTSVQRSSSVAERVTLEEMESYKTSPIFSSSVGRYLEAITLQNPESTPLFTQYGLVGLHNVLPSAADDLLSDDIQHVEPEDNLVITNMDVPWSAFICGSQGAGKSHTLSCLLENALIGDHQISRLPNPLAAMVFHYDGYTNAMCSQVCEAAYLCSSGIPVTVLVSPSNIWAMTSLYTNLPGLPPGCPRPKVLPLYLSENLLDISTMLKLMAIDPNADHVPFYMETVMSILREMAMEGLGAGAFSYTEFRNRVAAVNWVQGQIVPLNLRLQLLDSFLQPTQFTRTSRPAPAKENIWAFEPGTMTIVDLSDPFVSSNDACALFSICLSLFLEDRGKCGRVVAMDEAHKFLLQSGAARALTADLTSVIRQQRHTGTRVLIATQEPTLSPEIIDLANVTFVHRFTSPAWYDVLKKHLAGANKHDSANSKATLFETIVNLHTGEALMFCPTALTSVDSDFASLPRIRRLGNGYLRVNIRKRLTADGGRSILASETAPALSLTSLEQIPMHIVAKPSKAPFEGKGTGKNRGTGYARDSGYSSPLPSASQSGMPAAQPPPIAPTMTLPQQTPQPPVASRSMPSQSVPQASPAPVQAATNVQAASLARSKGALPPDTRLLIEQEGRVQMRRNYETLKWQTRKKILWPTLWRSIERELKLEPGIFAANPVWHAVLKQAVIKEQDSCNKGKN